MRVDAYPDRTDKLLLACESAKVAKQYTIMEEGIGEDLAYNVMCWRHDFITAIFQLKSEHANSEDRLNRTLEAIAVARFGFRADAISFIAEGYCAADPSEVDLTKPLSEQFVSNQEVRECLTVTHLEDGDTEIIALPYVYAVPRHVNWGTPLRYPAHPTDNQFVKSIHNILELRVDQQRVDDDTWNAAIAADVEAFGFHVHYDLEHIDPITGI
jgi:hypothetical protein